MSEREFDRPMASRRLAAVIESAVGWIAAPIGPNRGLGGGRRDDDASHDVGKEPGADLLRDLIGFDAARLMELKGREQDRCQQSSATAISNGKKDAERRGATSIGPCNPYFPLIALLPTVYAPHGPIGFVLRISCPVLG